MQYKTITLPSGVNAVEAQYSHYGIEEYDSNPFIQALPKLYSVPEIIDKLTLRPLFNEEENKLDSAIRQHLLYRMYKFYQPLPVHLDVWNMINTLIRQGYLARNPFSREFTCHLHETGRLIMNKEFNLLQNSSFRTTASAGTIIGISGMGKTTTVNRVLNHIPQLIIHSHYKDRELSQIQVTWLKLEAPHNGSLKALCLQYFIKIDDLLGTDNFKRYVSRNLSVDALLPLMGKIAQNIGLGILIIDELQHLVSSKVDRIMNYFVTLINTFGLPIIFIGTPASYPIFERELRIARRITGNGEICWNNMEKGAEFELFLEGMWKYQLTRRYSTLTPEIETLFYEETQGITDLIVKLFVNVQQYGIATGAEQITITSIKKVAKDSFRAMARMLQAIKSGNPYKIAQYQDIQQVQNYKVKEVIVKPLQSKNDVTLNSIVAKEEKEVLLENTVALKKKRISSYNEEDIRGTLVKAKKDVVKAYNILQDLGLIDDMQIWEG